MEDIVLNLNDILDCVLRILEVIGGSAVVASVFPKAPKLSEKGPAAIATVKKKYVDTGMCKLDLYYFGDRVAYDDAYAYVGGSTRA